MRMPGGTKKGCARATPWWNDALYAAVIWSRRQWQGWQWSTVPALELEEHSHGGAIAIGTVPKLGFEPPYQCQQAPTGKFASAYTNTGW